MRSAYIFGAVMAAGVGTGFLGASSADADVAISDKPTQNMTCTDGTCSPTAKKAVLNVADLATMLSSGDVKISSGEQALDIEINAKLSWASTHRLTLDAYRSIAFNKPLDIAGGALTIVTNDGGTGGDFRFFKRGRIKFANTSSSLVINKQHYTLVKSIKQLGFDIRRDPHGYYALAGSISLAKHLYSAAPLHNGFAGIFEGLGNTISNLTVDSATFGESIGLFDELSTATIRDIGLTSVNIIGGSTNQGVAPLAGLSQLSTIMNCYAKGQVTSGASSLAGGLIGLNQFGIVRNSYSLVAVINTGDASVVGGLVGENDQSTVVESYAIGSIKGGDGTMVGGLVGYNHNGAISDSYATGSVEGGTNAFVGGLVGSNEDDPHETTKSMIDSSYSVGPVSGGSGSLLGGLIGEVVNKARVKDSYWDLDTSGISDPSQGAGNVQNDKGITGLTTAQFLAGLPKGFKNTIWSEKPTLNGGFPYLDNNPPPK